MKENNSTSPIWLKYEKLLKEQLKNNVPYQIKKCRSFYEGDQWQYDDRDLPHPVFNLVARVCSHLASKTCKGIPLFTYFDNALPYKNEKEKALVESGLSLLSKNATFRWEKDNMQSLLYSALLDACIVGKSAFYVYWDKEKTNHPAYNGDIATCRVDAYSLFYPLYNTPLQRQPYLLFSHKEEVQLLKEKAKEEGLSEREINRIIPDENEENFATVVTEFVKKNGKVFVTSSTKEVIFKEKETALTLYPFAEFYWREPLTEKCFVSSPCHDLIENQKYVNLAYALAMKHMTDTAFSKVIYDKNRIAEWNSDVGEAIGILGGGSVSDAVSIVGVGEMQNGYLDLIESVLTNSKKMEGATESSLGEEKANNTSAIETLQKADESALLPVRENTRKALAELALIWADFLFVFYPKERGLCTSQKECGFLSEELKKTLLSSAVKIVGSEET